MAQLQQKDYSSQDVAPEQEALEQQRELKLSLETQVFLNYHYGSRNRRKLLKTLFRANVVLNNQRTDKTRYLSLKAVEIANAVLHKIVNGKKVLLSHQYLSKITECDTSKQNNNIIAQLANLFDITNHNFLYRDGKVYRHHVEFKLKASVLEEAKNSGALISEFHWKKISSPINNNKDISNRNIIRSRANFANVKNSDSQNLGTEPEKPEESVELTSPKAATITSIRTKAPRPRNKRKTRSNAEEKQRRVANAPVAKTTQNVVPNGFLGKGKRLSEIQPYLTDELCEKLRSSSGKLFTNKAIREITKAIAASENGSQAFFYHINGVVSYLTPALVKEKRDPNKIGAEGYYTLAGMTEEDKLLRKQEQFLESVELTAMRQACPENQFKGKLVGTLGRRTAYNLLFAMKHTTLRQNTLVISLTSHVELTEHQQRIILAQAQAVFNCTDLHGNSQFVERIEVKTDMEMRPHTTNSSNSQIELPQGIWGKVAKSFIEEYGHELYTHWLGSKVVFEEDTEQQTIYLKACSDMVKDRIEQAYLPFLSKIGMNFGINKLEVVV